MFGSIGGGEILMILVLALLLFGPRRLPQIGKTLGKTLAEFRRATNDLKHNLEQEVAMEDLKELQAAGSGLRSAGREIADAVSASNPLGIARGAIEAPPAAATAAPGGATPAEAVRATRMSSDLDLGDEGPDGEADDRS